MENKLFYFKNYETPIKYSHVVNGKEHTGETIGQYFSEHPLVEKSFCTGQLSGMEGAQMELWSHVILKNGGRADFKEDDLDFKNMITYLSNL